MNRKPQSLKQSLKQPAPPLSFAAFQFPAFLMDKGKIKKKGLLQNSPNEKNEIDFPQRGCLSHFFVVS